MTQNPNNGQNPVQNQPSRPQFRPMQRPPNSAGVRPTFQARPTRPASAGNPLVRPAFRPMSAGNSPERPLGVRPLGARPMRPAAPSPQFQTSNPALKNNSTSGFAAGNPVMPVSNGNGNGYPGQSQFQQPAHSPADNSNLSHQLSSMSLSSNASKSRAKRVYTTTPTPVASSTPAQFNQAGANSLSANGPIQPQFNQPGANTFQSPNSNQFPTPVNQFQQPGPQGGGFTPQQTHNQYQPQVGVSGMPRPGIPQFQPPVGQSQYQPGIPQQPGKSQPMVNGQPGMQQPGMNQYSPGVPAQQIANQYQPGVAGQNQYQPGIPGQQMPNQFQRAAAPPAGYPNSQPPAQKIDPDQIPSAVAVRAEDQAKFGTSVFATSSRGVPPIATTHFRSTDEGIRLLILGSANPRFIRSTLYNLPTTEEVLKNSFMPMAVMIQPLADLAPEEVPLI